MAGSPVVSVVMAVRNAAGALRRSANSILGQEGVELELILVENGSTDETLRIAQELAASDPRVRVIQSDPPGLTAALMAGCAAARGEVIARQDAGDVSLPRRLRTQLELLRRDPACVLVSCGVRYAGPEGEELYDAIETDGEAVRRSLLHDDAARIRGINHHGSALFPRTAYEQAGGYRPQFRFAQDLDLWIRLAAQGTIAFAPEVLYVAAITPEAISSLHRAEQEELTRIAVALRGTHRSEETSALLARAASVQPASRAVSPRSTARGLYFIGRCLQARGDVRARKYLAAAVYRDPWMLRGWVAWARSRSLRDVPRAPQTHTFAPPQTIAAAIPTYGREQVLLDTIHALLALPSKADEIVIVDQTPKHEPHVEQRLRELDASGAIRLVKQETPSIPLAMNRLLVEAKSDLVLFLDDDIIPSAQLIDAHRRAYVSPDIWAVSGQVLQPGQREIASPPRTRSRWGDLHFSYNQNEGAWVDNVMAGNLSVRRAAALGIGGFDENYAGVAYRFETDFARRIVAAGGKIRFEPAASIRHLQAPSGGTRMHGGHLTSASPAHSAGDYYFALMTLERARWLYIVTRFFRSVRTKFHLRHPWWIPVKLTGELRGLALALRLRRRGRSLIRE